MNPKDNPNDKIYTPAFIVDEVMSVFGELIGESDQILEPFRGEGAFFDKLPQGRTDWCEIDQYRDFFDYNRKVDWIVTNPPYSTFKELLSKCLTTADHVVLVIPVNKILSSMPRLMDIQRHGFGIKRIHYLGSGRQIGFPFGFAVGAVYMMRGHTNVTEMTYEARCYKAKAK